MNSVRIIFTAFALLVAQPSVHAMQQLRTRFSPFLANFRQAFRQPMHQFNAYQHRPFQIKSSHKRLLVLGAGACWLVGLDVLLYRKHFEKRIQDLDRKIEEELKADIDKRSEPSSELIKYDDQHKAHKMLYYGALYRDIRIIKEALARGADITYQEKHSGNATPLLAAVGSAIYWSKYNTNGKVSNADHRVIDFLLNQPGCEINAQDKWGKTALLQAKRNATLFEHLINRGADINARVYPYHRTILTEVGYSPELTAILIKHKIDLNIQDDVGRTALIWAAIFKYLPSIELLKAAGADQTIRDNKGKTFEDYLQ